jgi:hypothetical protein
VLLLLRNTKTAISAAAIRSTTAQHTPSEGVLLYKGAKAPELGASFKLLRYRGTYRYPANRTHSTTTQSATVRVSRVESSRPKLKPSALALNSFKTTRGLATYVSEHASHSLTEAMHQQIKTVTALRVEDADFCESKADKDAYSQSSVSAALILRQVRLCHPKGQARPFSRIDAVKGFDRRRRRAIIIPYSIHPSHYYLNMARQLCLVAALLAASCEGFVVLVAPAARPQMIRTTTSRLSESIADKEIEEPKMNPNNPNLPQLKGDFDWDAKFGGDDDWITENVPGKTVLNEIDLAKQVTALTALEETWRKKRAFEKYEAERKVGWTAQAEILNGRSAMFFLVTGLLTELWTGISMPGQVEEMLRIGGFLGFD